MPIIKPAPSEYYQYYGTYVDKVANNDLLPALVENQETFSAFIKSIPVDKLDYRYAEGKWSIKEVIIHLTDAERIFAYRALRFARKDKTELAGFEENNYVPESNASSYDTRSLIEEFEAVRKASITLFKSFTAEMSLRTGSANGKEISVRALGFVIVGHTMHHMQVIKERYLS
jgi:uncharacterized damage-inducible protein DinB